MRRGRFARCVVLAVGLALHPDPVRAVDIPGEVSGYVAADSRIFFYDPALADQRRESGIADVVLAPEYFLGWNAGADGITVKPFFRGDSDDTHRTHFDLRELDYWHLAGDWEWRVGISKVFWGVTESAHVVDIINQTDAVEDVDGEDKLGQPMIHLTRPSRWGIFEAFFLSGFRDRTFPGPHGRLRAAFAVDEDDPRFESDLDRAQPEAAGRWGHTLGGWQVALSHFYGTGRAPRFATDVPTALPATVDELLSRTRLTPIYDLIHQTGLELQFTGDALLLKLEAIGRAGQGDYRFASAAGFEYTAFGVFDTDADVGILGEFLGDTYQPRDLPSRSDIPADAPVDAVAAALGNLRLEAPPSAFEHDVFVGLRVSPNDVQSTQLLFGAIVDVVDGSRVLSVEASRRLADRWSLAVDLRFFDGFDSASFFHSVVRDDFLQLRLSYFL